MRKIELLAPARTADAGRIAVDYGADALYIGAPKFGARHAAGNSLNDVARMIDYAHAYGVRVYVTLNTLVYEPELDEARQLAMDVCAVGADALIVQDMAFARMDLPIALHASTQTCNATPERVRFLGESGFSRVILERGLTLEQISEISRSCNTELEAFVHGAICVGYSGQCYLSRTMGQRSGNRGDCIQACRMTYDLIDSRENIIMAKKHLLSVQDFNLISRVGQLLDAGVSSFKIEGRLKDDTYLKNVVRSYRTQLDKEIGDRNGLQRSSIGCSISSFTPDLQKTFTRDGGLYFIDGKRSGVASFDTPKAMGSYIGHVESVERDFIKLYDSKLIAGDGICFSTEDGLVGTNVNRVDGDMVFPNKMEGLDVGTEVYRNYDHRFVAAVGSDRAKREIDVSADILLKNSDITLVLEDESGARAQAELTKELGARFDVAKNPDKMMDTLRTQIAKSGDTIFRIINVNIALQADEMPFLTISDINALRRDALEKLLVQRLVSYVKPAPATESIECICPETKLTAQSNVINSLAERFYREHGVQTIERGAELRLAPQDFGGEQVMSSSYCIRREIGECLLENPQHKDELFLQRGEKKYKLEFDCKNCMMHLRYEWI